MQPVETEFGRKRRIDQTSCNKDFSCVSGFCPSFVTVHGAKLKKADGLKALAGALDGVPEPETFSLDEGWAAVINGVGGTGIVTIASILGMAAHLEGKGCGMIDMAGLAQKGGAVFSHMRIAKTPADISAIRVSAGKADLILGCDLVVSGAKTVLASARENHTLFVANTAEIMPGDFTRSPDYSLPVERLKRAISKAAGEGKAHFFNATETTRALFGNTVAANMFMLGFAFQKGGVPLSADAVEKAVELNGEAVQMNVDAFQWGRRAAHEPDFVQGMVDKARVAPPALATSLDDIIAKRAAFLTAYQNADYAARYKNLLEPVLAAEKNALGSSTLVSEAAARSLFKLMAIKDEYEVARLYTNGAFVAQLGEAFASYERLEFHLAPPAFSRKNAKGQLVKRRFGAWMLNAFGVLARFKVLRGTPFDVFGYSAERSMERGLITAYEQDLAFAAERLDPTHQADITELLSLPMEIRGFGHVKHANLEKTQIKRSHLMAKIAGEAQDLAIAAE